MVAKIFQRGMYGIAFGGIVTFIAQTIFMLIKVNPPVFQIWLYMLASFILGIYFALASLLFEVDHWSPLKKTVIHYCLSVAVYFIVSLSVSWISLNGKAIIIAIIGFTLIYLLFWFGYKLYYKRMEVVLNNSLQKR